MFRVGLTGGVASGKTTVAEMFAELGAGLVDTDIIARDVVAPGEPGLDEVREAFGEAVLTRTGELDRAALRHIVFNNDSQRHKLESILHPLIRARALAQVDELQTPYALVAVPLLVETGFAKLVHRVLVVDCPTELQIARLMERDALSRTSAQSMLAAQVDRDTRLQAANDILDNSGTLEEARAQVVELHSKYLALARDCREEEGRPE